MIAVPKSLVSTPPEPHDHAHAHHGHSHRHARDEHHHAGEHHPTQAAPRVEPRLSLIALSGLQRFGLALPVIGVLWLLTFWAMSHA